jgi:hypothetical protein
MCAGVRDVHVIHSVLARILALGMLGFETKTEAFTRFVAEKFGFMFFPVGRFCFNFLYAHSHRALAEAMLETFFW